MVLAQSPMFLDLARELKMAGAHSDSEVQRLLVAPPRGVVYLPRVGTKSKALGRNDGTSLAQVKKGQQRHLAYHDMGEMAYLDASPATRTALVNVASMAAFRFPKRSARLPAQTPRSTCGMDSTMSTPAVTRARFTHRVTQKVLRLTFTRQFAGVSCSGLATELLSSSRW